MSHPGLVSLVEEILPAGRVSRAGRRNSVRCVRRSGRRPGRGRGQRLEVWVRPRRLAPRLPPPRRDPPRAATPTKPPVARTATRSAAPPPDAGAGRFGPPPFDRLAAAGPHPRSHPTVAGHGRSRATSCWRGSSRSRPAQPGGIRTPQRHRLRLRDPGRLAVPREHVPRPQRAGGRVPRDPVPDPHPRGAGPAAERARALRAHEGARPRHGPDRLGQVHDARGHDRSTSTARARDHIITIEDPIEFVHENKKCLVNQREVGYHTESLPGRPARRAARGPRRRSGRRDARPGDDRDRDRDGRDGAPRLRHAPHHDRAARRSTASSTSSRPTGRTRSADAGGARCIGVVAQRLCRRWGGPGGGATRS